MTGRRCPVLAPVLVADLMGYRRQRTPRASRSVNELWPMGHEPSE